MATVNPCELRNIWSCLTSAPVIPSLRLRVNVVIVGESGVAGVDIGLEAGNIVVDEGLSVQMEPEGHPGTICVINEFRYAVVEALGASNVARVEAETEPPRLEKLAVAAMDGAGATGVAAQITETFVTLLEVIVPDPDETEQV